MQPEDILTGVGETAAAFAGFSGIVAALGARSVIELPPVSRFRFSNLLVVSVSTCLLSFAPLVLGAFLLASPSSIWAWSSSALAIFALLFPIAAEIRRRRISNAQVTARRGRRWMAVLSICVLLSICVSKCANAVGWPLERGAALYVAGLFGLLTLSGVQFILLALDSTPIETQSAV